MKKIIINSVTTTALIIALSACANTANSKNENIMVYISNGSIQCESDGKTSAQTATLLMNNDVMVNSSQCANLSNVMVATMCGAPTTNINLHEIAASDIKKAKAIGFANVSTLKQDGNVGYNVADCK